MSGIIRNTLARLIQWLDIPPPAPAPGTQETHWEFLGDLLGELASLTDTETEAFAARDYRDPDAIARLADQWIRPVWARFTPTSRDKIIATLDSYLATGNEKTGWILPSYGIPIDTDARLFFTLIRRELTGSATPDTIDTTRYRENDRQAFANALFSHIGTGTGENGEPLPELPVRHGINLPRELARHDASQPLQTLRRWAATGITPDGIQGLPCDAARWTEKTDPDTIRTMAASRFARQQGTRLGVHRLTLTFTHPVGEGYLAGAPDTLVTTRKARCLIDRMGYLVRCYPILRG